MRYNHAQSKRMIFIEKKVKVLFPKMYRKIDILMNQ